MRNSSSTETKSNKRMRAQPIGQLHRRQRLQPQRAPPFGGHALRGRAPTTPPRRRTSPWRTRCSSTCSRSSASDHSCRASTSWMAVAATSWLSSWTSCASVSSTSRCRVLEEDVALAHALGQRHVFDQQHHAVTDVAAQEVVEVLGGARPGPRVAGGQRVAHGGDVVGRVDQAEQAEDAVAARARASRSSARASRQSWSSPPARNRL